MKYLGGTASAKRLTDYLLKDYIAREASFSFEVFPEPPPIPRQKGESSFMYRARTENYERNKAFWVSVERYGSGKSPIRFAFSAHRLPDGVWTASPRQMLLGLIQSYSADATVRSKWLATGLREAGLHSFRIADRSYLELDSLESGVWAPKPL